MPGPEPEGKAQQGDPVALANERARKRVLLRKAGVQNVDSLADDDLDIEFLRHRVLQGLQEGAEKRLPSQGEMEPSAVEKAKAERQGALGAAQEQVRGMSPRDLVDLAFPKEERRPGVFVEPGTGVGPFGVLNPPPKGGDTLLSGGMDILAEVAEKPVLKQAFDLLARPVGAVKEIVHGFQTGKVGRGFERAGEALTFQIDAEDLVSVRQMLEEAGVPEGEVLNLGLIGSFKPRTILEVGGEAVMDPIIISALRIGALNARGISAAKEGQLAKAMLPGRKFGVGPRDLSLLGSDLEAQMLAGQRSLLSVYLPGKGRVHLWMGPAKYVDAPIASMYDWARRGVAQSPFGRLFNVSPGPQFTLFRQQARGATRDVVNKRLDAAGDIWAHFERVSAETGRPMTEIAHEALQSAKRLPESVMRSVKAPLPKGMEKVWEAAALAEDVAEFEKLTGRRVEGPARLVHFTFRDKADNPLATVAVSGVEGGDTVLIDNILSLVGEESLPLSTRSLGDLQQAIVSEFPEAKFIVGDRITGVRAGPQRDLRMVKRRIPDHVIRRSQELVGGVAEEVFQEQRKLFKQYRKMGMSVDEAINSARTATMLDIDPMAAPLGQRLQDHFASGFFDEVDAGLMVASLTDPGQHYIFRSLTEEGRSLVKGKHGRAFRKFMNEWWAGASFAKKRRFLEGYTIPEANEWIRDNVPGFKGDMFEPDPYKLTVKRALAAEGPLYASNLHEFGFRRFGKRRSPELLDAGWVEARHLLEENKLQAHRLHGGGHAKPLIDARQREILQAMIESDAMKEARLLSPQEQRLKFGPLEETARREAIKQLTEEGVIAPTKFGRKSTFGDLSVDDMVIPPEIAKEIRHQQWMLAHPSNPGLFWRTFDGLTNFTKTGLTTMWPGFLARNNINNFWMLRVADAYGGTIPASQVIRNVAFGDGERIFQTAAHGPLTARQIIEMAENRGGLGLGPTSSAELGGKGFLDRRKNRWRKIFQPIEEVERIGLPTTRTARPGLSDIGFGVTGKARFLVGAPKAPFRMLSRAGRALNEASEDYAKLSVIMDRLQKGMDIDVAVADAKKFLFDYSDLGVREKQVWRRVVPFYTFPRKNLPLMLETMVTQPGKVAELGLLQRALSSDDPIDRTIVPPFMQRTLHFTRRDDQHPILRIYTANALGLEDAAQILDAPVDEFLNRMNFMLKAIVQQSVNQDLFRKIPLSESDLAPPALRHFPKSVKEWMDFREIRKDGQIVGYRMNPTLRNWMLNGPITSAGSRAFSTFEDLGTATERGRDQTRPSEPLRALTGIQARAFDPEQQFLQQALFAAKHYRRYLERELERGRVQKFGNRYSLRIETLSPEEIEALGLTEAEVKILAQEGKLPDLSEEQIERLKGEVKRTARAIALYEASLGVVQPLRSSQRQRGLEEFESPLGSGAR